MSGPSNASHQATQGSDLGYVPTLAIEVDPTKEMLILTVSKFRHRSNSNFPLSHSLANIEGDTQYALRSYLQDQQAHEKLALKLQIATVNESTRQDKDAMKETQS